MNLHKTGNTRRENIPGKGPILRDIKGINDQITKVEKEIKQNNDLIHTIIKKGKEDSPRNQLLTKLQELKGRTFEMREHKNKLMKELNQCKIKVAGYKENLGETGSGFVSEESIENKLNDLNMELIRNPHSTAVEKRIAQELTSLRMKKSQLGDAKENMKQLKITETRMKEIKGLIGQINKEMAVEYENIKKIKDELDKINETNKLKNPEIETLNNRNKVLKEEKGRLFTLREEKRGEVHALEVEYKKIEKEILVAVENEKAKELVKKNIQQKKKEINTLQKKTEEFDAKIFDRILMDLNAMATSKVYSLNLDLVSILMKNNIVLPKDKNTLNKTIEEVKKARENADETFEDRTKQIREEIQMITIEISKMSEELEAMPETNVELLRKGGYFMKKGDQ